MRYRRGAGPVFGCLAVGLSVVALIAAWLMGGAYTETFPRPFDAARWQRAANQTSDVRCGMIADLQLRIGVVGRTRAELTALLGAPIDHRRDPSRGYWTLCPSFMDMWILEVRWQDGRAVSAIVRDS
jgi:hypothetical protein